MTDKNRNSKYQFKKFVKGKGIFARGKNRDTAKDENSDSGKPQQTLKYYFRRYIGEFQDQKSRLVFVLFVGFCTCIIGAVIPWTSKIMIDYILPQRNMPLLLVVCLLLFAVALMRHFIQILQDYSTQALMGSFVVRLKHRLMEHLHTLPLVELQKLKTGGIITRLQEDTEGAGNLIFHGLLSPFNALVMLFISMTSLLFISWKTTLVSILFAGLMCMVAYFFFYVMRPLQRALRKDRSVINASLTESFGGIQVVKSFRRENSIKKDFGINTNLLWRKSLYGVVAGMFVHRSIWTLHFIAEISIWLIGGYFFINGTLSVGSLVVFISFLMWIFQPVFMIMSSFSETQKCIACTERTIDLLDMEPDIVDKEDAVIMESFRKGMKFERVSFTYPDGTQALDNVELFIPKGKVTALVGPSGGGKTTLTNLVLRFYDVTEGKITLDTQDIRDIKLSSYRKLISLVLQDVFLFDGTVRENIMFGKKDASQEEVEDAAKVAHCSEFIEELQDKYDTIIGERGVKLSGGQKQRIALARAIIANPQLLILDEATSNLDSESESLIQNALKHIFKGRTSIVIAHRLSTIMDADNIIVIDKGKVVEQGRHEELLLAKGRYYEMYTKQMEKAKSVITLWSESSQPEKKEN
jgi:ATP-binding cassette subfamily B protein/subfamily B ATP-binding cassette protein MsbA